MIGSHSAFCVDYFIVVLNSFQSCIGRQCQTAVWQWRVLDGLNSQKAPSCRIARWRLCIYYEYTDCHLNTPRRCTWITLSATTTAAPYRNIPINLWGSCRGVSFVLDIMNESYSQGSPSSLRHK